MRKCYTFSLLLLCLLSIRLHAQHEAFAPKRVVNTQPMRQPFAMVMGPDDSLWITERPGYVMRVNTANGNKTQLLDITNEVLFTVSADRLTIQQDGVFGIALHPELNKGTGNDYVYLAYCYNAGGGVRKTRIVRFLYDRAAAKLTNETVLLQGIPASNDHNSGRLIIGNAGTSSAPDYKLFYTVGDGGANQFDNACKEIQAQNTPTSAEMSAADYHTYGGKCLRLNLDGSIPADNPLFNGVRSHIYTKGHRNAQGLAWERDPAGNLVPGGILYNSEQGPAVSDEINILRSGMNYGWPRVAGMQDDFWYRYYSWAAGGQCGSYSGECSSQQVNTGLLESSFYDSNYVNPIFDMYAIEPNPATCSNYLTNPTVAPSSEAYYYFTNKIPGWYRSLLVPTLKGSALLRFKLNDAGTETRPMTFIVNATPPCSGPVVVDAPSAPVIDGTVDVLWAKAPKNNIGKTISGTIQTGSTWQAMYDATNLYVLVQVKDANLSSTGTNVWDQDGVELYLAGDNSKIGPYGTNDHQYRFNWNMAPLVSNITGTTNSTTGIVYAIPSSTGGYTLEVSIPWTTIGGHPPVNGRLLGFDVNINDQQNNAGAREATAGWNGTNSDDYQNTASMGTIPLSVCLATTPAGTPVISTIATASAIQGILFEDTITASNSPVSYNASGLPAGLTVNTSTGVISGIPAVAGTYTITLSATNALGTGSQMLTLTVANNMVKSAYGGTPPVLPVKIEAENYDNGGEGVAYHDDEVLNQTGAYRTAEGVDIENCSEGGYSISYMRTGEWMEYTFDVATAGTYTVEARVASGLSGKTFHINIDDVNVSGTISVPNTGGFQTWQSVTFTTSLTVGQKIMRVVVDADDFNLNYINFTLGDDSGNGGNGSSSTPATAASATVGASYICKVEPVHATSYAATGLPPGLSIDPSTGIISGTPTEEGIYTATLTIVKPEGISIIGDTMQYFRDIHALNRFRDVAIGHDGITIYLLTDSVGSTSGPTSGVDGGVYDKGRILAFKYIGQVISCPNLPDTFVAPTATGNTYQWQMNDGSGFANVADGVLYTGTSTSMLVLNNADTSMYDYRYRCAITNGGMTTYTQESILKFGNTWTGAVNTAWEEPGNWSCGIVPDSTSDVVINFGTVVINSQVVIRSLTINSDVSLTINPSKGLTILH